MPNIEKLDELVAWATMEDVKRRAGLASEWDQGLFVSVTPAPDQVLAHCGTACCMAGKTVIDAGAMPLIDLTDFNTDDDDYPVETLWAVYADGTEVGIESEAQRLLDINHAQAYQLFHGGNNLKHVIDVVNKIKAGDEAAWIDRYADRYFQES